MSNIDLFIQYGDRFSLDPAMPNQPMKNLERVLKPPTLALVEAELATALVPILKAVEDERKAAIREWAGKLSSTDPLRQAIEAVAGHP